MPSSSDTAETEIRQVMADWTRAFLARDVDGMMSFYADGDAFSAFDLMGPIEFHGGEQWRRNWVDFLGAWDGPFAMESAETEIHAGGDVAFVRSLVHQTGSIGGHAVDLWCRQTIGLRRVDGRWLMVHSHVSVPIDLASGRARTDLSPSHPG